jgi:hypothetical protein
MRTAETIERDKAAKSPDSSSETVAPKDPCPQLKPFQWKPGQSGNPGGRKADLAKQIARAVFEENPEAVIRALSAALNKGNAYTFKELADRAYGKVTDKLEVTEAPPTEDADLNERIAQLERDLGLARQIDEAGGVGSAKERARETASATKDK